MEKKLSILWLASWYPNTREPFDGDFIQRHAIATSLYVPVTIIYVAQYGAAIAVPADKTEQRQTGNLREVIIYFSFKKVNIKLVDRIRYNLKYHSCYKSMIKKYFSENGVPGIVHVHIPMKAGLIAKWIKRKWHIPYIVSEHSVHYIPDTSDSFFRKKKLHQLTIRKIFAGANMVTNVSLFYAGIVKRLFDLKKSAVITNTVDTRFFFPPDNAPEKFRFIHVSTGSPQKNIKGLIDTFLKLSAIRQDWELVLTGPLHGDLQKWTDEPRFRKSISSTGEISYERVALEMQKSSAFVLFSNYENFPCVIAEALCCGLPVISTNVGGIAEVINTTNGILVEPGEEVQLLTALIRMIDSYSSFDKKKIAEEAKNKFSYEVIGQKFLDIYNQETRGKLTP